jgi:hypothetical protein
MFDMITLSNLPVWDGAWQVTALALTNAADKFNWALAPEVWS